MSFYLQLKQTILTDHETTKNPAPIVKVLSTTLFGIDMMLSERVALWPSAFDKHDLNCNDKKRPEYYFWLAIDV